MKARTLESLRTSGVSGTFTIRDGTICLSLHGKVAEVDEELCTIEVEASGDNHPLTTTNASVQRFDVDAPRVN